MAELNEELWKLGILAKTEHNEVAPAQHELAPIFTTTNISTDHNQLTMEIMQKVAAKHGLVCLLHEKPFAGVNGSGKHNNWSMATNTGINLLAPGATPYENAQFLLFLCAVIKAVDDYQDLLRISVATAGNDHRLGANEAPPAVVSMFLGDELTEVLEAIETGNPYKGAAKTQLKLGVDVLPKFNRDTTDRNRTSPFAFTGNKFEFRMLGSSNSIACANIMLNAAVAESLKIYADRLEGVADFETALHEMIKKTIKDHKRIIFNGNGYDEAWIKEATEQNEYFKECVQTNKTADGKRLTKERKELFELLIKEFERLKADEQKQIGWNAKRELSKINIAEYYNNCDQILKKADLLASLLTAYRTLCSTEVYASFNAEEREELVLICRDSARDLRETDVNDKAMFESELNDILEGAKLKMSRTNEKVRIRVAARDSANAQIKALAAEANARINASYDRSEMVAIADKTIFKINRLLTADAIVHYAEKNKYKPGDTITLKVFRNSKYLEISVVLSEASEE